MVWHDRFWCPAIVIKCSTSHPWEHHEWSRFPQFHSLQLCEFCQSVDIETHLQVSIFPVQLLQLICIWPVINSDIITLTIMFVQKDKTQKNYFLSSPYSLSEQKYNLLYEPYYSPTIWDGLAQLLFLTLGPGNSISSQRVDTKNKLYKFLFTLDPSKSNCTTVFLQMPALHTN